MSAHRGSMAIEITERKRRLVLDWVLVGVIVACLTAFFDLCATVKSQTTSFNELSARLAKVEEEVKQTAQHSNQASQNTATKGDILRLEGRIDQLVNLMLTKNGR